MTIALPPDLAAAEREVFVGRDEEMATLLTAWRRVRAGERRLVVIGGEPGIGKTRLAGALAAVALRDGATVLHGRCDPEMVSPWQPFAEALRQLGSDPDTEDALAAAGPGAQAGLGILVPDLVSLGSDRRGALEPDRAALFGSCADVLRAVARETPVVLTIDDLHWAGQPTLQLVRHLQHALDGFPVLFLTTYRDTEVGRPLSDLLADLRLEGGTERLSLGGWAADAIGEFVDEVLGVPADAASADRLVDELLRDTGGNPFFVGELVRHLVDEGAVEQAEAGWAPVTVTSPALPARVRDVLDLRLGRLPDQSRAHLAAAAVVGPRFDLTVLNGLGLQGDALDAIEPAVGARLVTELPGPGERFGFVHALVRQALVEQLSAARLVRLHEQIAHVLEQRGADPAELAAHYLAAGRPELVERGARHALNAAASVTWRSAPEAAVELTSQAITALKAVSRHDETLMVELLCERGMALIVLQRLNDFLATAGEAVTIARRTGSRPLLAMAASTRACYTPAGTDDPTFLSDIEEVLPSTTEPALRSRLLCGRSVARLLTLGNRADALADARDAALLADEAGAFFERWMARFVGSLTAIGDPDVETVDQMGRELLDLGSEVGDENAICHGIRARAVAQLIRGDLDAHTDMLAEAERRWRGIHNQWGMATGVMARYLEAAARGRWDDAEAAVMELAPYTANDSNFAAVYAGQLIMLRELQDRRVEVEDFVAASAASFPEILSLRIEHGLCLVDRGDLDGARVICREVLAHPAMGNPDYAELSRTAWAVELAVAVGEVDPLPALVASLRRWAGQILVVNVGVGILGPVERYLGMAAAALGDDDEADRCFAVALAWEEANGCVPLAERTRRAMAFSRK